MATNAKAPQNTALPTPNQRPTADTVIYDGQCRICTSQVQRLARWDGSGRLAFLAIDEPEVRRRWPQLKFEDLMREMHLVEPGGRVHRGAEAFCYLSRRLPRLYFLAPLLNFPGTLSLWQALYRQVARRRYRLGKVQCDGGTCHLHG
jgi:predicted DCC family thiol-disulfide oxidoreductase YuxK